MTKQKYEREISEILDRLERQGRLDTPAPPKRRRGWSFGSNWRPPTRSWWRWSNGLWLALSLGLPLAAVMVQQYQLLAGLLALLGILIFLSPLVLRFGGGVRPAEQTTWRGRVIEMPVRGDSLAARWRYRLWVWRQRWEQRWRR